MEVSLAVLYGRLDALFRHLSLRALSWRKNHSLGSLTLPPELILSIMSHLSYAEKLSLSLTCKTFHRVCFPGKPDKRHSKEEMSNFLINLERDMPTFYFCHSCIKLHPWRNMCFLCLKRPCRKCGQRPIVWTDWDCSKPDYIAYESGPGSAFVGPDCFCISYIAAHVTMKRHRLGRTHGLPPSALNPDRVRQRCPGATTTRCGTVRIIDDHLMASVRLKFSSVKGDPVSGLRGFIDRDGPWICHHLRIGARRPFCREKQVPELEKRGSSGEEFLPCSSSVRSCIACMSDYCIDIKRRSSKKGWVINITTYHDLGTARTPFEWEWMVLKEECSRAPPRWVHGDARAAGTVRNKWLRADGIVSDLKGEWVEPIPWFLLDRYV